MVRCVEPGLGQSGHGQVGSAEAGVYCGRKAGRGLGGCGLEWLAGIRYGKQGSGPEGYDEAPVRRASLRDMITWLLQP